MKIRWVFLALLIAAAAAGAPAQSRGDVRIYIPLVVAADPMQADFFRRNFTMEISAAGYTVTENVADADYSMRLRVLSNAVVNSDGTSQPVAAGEHLYLLQIILMRNSDNSQLVSLSFGFSELDEMYNHNLSLVYQTLANVPLTRGDDKTLVKFMVGRDGVRDDWWRNKWVYLRVSFDFPISYYQIQPDGLYDGGFVYEGAVENPARYSRISHQIIPMPGATLGVEVQFLYWMSLEANVELRLGDAVRFAYIPGVGAQLKFPIKPSTHFMLEPYGAAVFSMDIDEEFAITFPRYAVGGGLQLGARGGANGVFFFDANYMYSLDEVVTRNPDTRFTQPEALRWSRFVIGLSLGYKVGFGNRGDKREENTTWLFNNN